MLLHPTRAHWMDAYGLIVRHRGWRTVWMTLFEAVLAVDPTFPRTQPDATTRVPDALLIARALRYAQRQAPCSDTSSTRAHG